MEFPGKTSREETATRERVPETCRAIFSAVHRMHVGKLLRLREKNSKKEQVEQSSELTQAREQSTFPPARIGEKSLEMYEVPGTVLRR